MGDNLNFIVLVIARGRDVDVVYSDGRRVGGA